MAKHASNYQATNNTFPYFYSLIRGVPFTQRKLKMDPTTNWQPPFDSHSQTNPQHSWQLPATAKSDDTFSETLNTQQGISSFAQPANVHNETASLQTSSDTESLTAALKTLSFGQLKPKTTVFYQNSITLHRYIRNKHGLSSIVERPKRIRAVKAGVALASVNLTPGLLSYTHTERRTNLESDQNVMLCHGQKYPAQFTQWCRESVDLLKAGRNNELPEGMPIGDLYVCRESLIAVEASLGIVYEGIDFVLSGGSESAFCIIRPPGHHCTIEEPMGFCFVNNVMCGAVHAWRKWGIDRVAILDIDLHHGNGTQDIAWHLNKTLSHDPLSAQNSSLKTFYGSIHDILSYPCESGEDTYVTAASLCINAHNQHIWNIHLEPYDSSLDHFNALYMEKYMALLTQAEVFLRESVQGGHKSLIFISAGFDACEHEYSSMQRHGSSVPTRFYFRFARDVSRMAHALCGSKVVAVLEGGYSDRALIAGTCALVSGLAAPMELTEDQAQTWWEVSKLEQIERRCAFVNGEKERKGRAGVVPESKGHFAEKVARILETLEKEDIELHKVMAATPDGLDPVSRIRSPSREVPTRNLRERKKPGSNTTTPETSPRGQYVKKKEMSPTKLDRQPMTVIAAKEGTNEEAGILD